MLAMKTRCELCCAALTHTGEAYICSFECTYCPGCFQRLEECPNCGGNLQPRPCRESAIRPVVERLPKRIGRVMRRAWGWAQSHVIREEARSGQGKALECDPCQVRATGW